jgi:putative PIG3 family NAD(P)H quinone oxidoreductase
MSKTSHKLPDVMMAMAIARAGGPEVLEVQKRPLPSLGRDMILIEVVAAGVNRPDILQRQGKYPPPAGASDLPGLEVAGRVVAIGADVRTHAVGDEVCALSHGGGYARYCAVHETHALPVPQGFSFIEAAAIPETFFTVWTNVFDRGKLKAGENFLVHGGTSGIGTTAIMLAKAFGATVFTTAGSEAKCDACRELGADVAIDYTQEDFVQVIDQLTQGRGVDLILDMVGGSYIERNYQAARDEGRIVQISFMQGTKADLRLLMMKRLTHTGSTLRPRSVAEKGAIAAALRQHVWPLFEAGRCKPRIDRVYPFGEAVAAHQRMESSAHIGKIVLKLGD